MFEKETTGGRDGESDTGFEVLESFLMFSNVEDAKFKELQTIPQNWKQHSGNSSKEIKYIHRHQCYFSIS